MRPNPPERTTPGTTTPGSEKFSPPMATHVVGRASLHALLTAKIDAPVTLVAATAGWGKTLLAASWIEAGAADRAAAWLSLDRTDDEPQVFWRAVAAALIPVVGRPAEELRRIVAGGAPTEDLPGMVVAGLRRAPRPVVLVLDDLHEIRSPQDPRRVAAARRTPAAGVLAAGHDASRSAVAAASPPLGGPGERRACGGSRLRARRGGGAVRAAHDRGGRRADRAVGRPHGRVACGASPGRPAPQRSGRRRGRRRRLLRGRPQRGGLSHHRGARSAESRSSSPSSRRSASSIWCAPTSPTRSPAVEDGAAMLAELAASHLFVEALGKPGRWYRLHRLIADILRARPSRRSARRDLHRRAAEWFRRNDMPLEAIALGGRGRALVAGRRPGRRRTRSRWSWVVVATSSSGC